MKIYYAQHMYSQDNVSCRVCMCVWPLHKSSSICPLETTFTPVTCAASTLYAKFYGPPNFADKKSSAHGFCAHCSLGEEDAK